MIDQHTMAAEYVRQLEDDYTVVTTVTADVWTKKFPGQYFGTLHRLEGPAIIRQDGTRCWYVAGIMCSAEVFPSRVIEFLLGCSSSAAQELRDEINKHVSDASSGWNI